MASNSLVLLVLSLVSAAPHVVIASSVIEEPHGLDDGLDDDTSCLQVSLHSRSLAAIRSEQFSKRLGTFAELGVSLARSEAELEAEDAVDAALIASLVQEAQTATKDSSFPKIIHNTWKSFDSLTPDEQASTQLWKTLNPDFFYLFWTDKDVAQFLQQYAPAGDMEMLQTMRPIERFDYFRYLALLKIGGVYSDIDVKPIKAVAEWNRTGVRLISGWETRLSGPEEAAQYAFSRADQVQQWTIASAPGHPVLSDVLERIRSNYKNGFTAMTTNYTGPGPWSDAILAYMGAPPPRVGYGEGPSGDWASKDALVHRKEAFAFRGFPSDIGDKEQQFLSHSFKGSWK